jgi:xanthine/uracil/vitamin C permease (AzgA family)
MNDPSELLAAAAAGIGIFLAVVASNLVLIPLTALAALLLFAGLLDEHLFRRRDGYDRSLATSATGARDGP